MANGPLAVALGYEFRREKFEAIPDKSMQDDDFTPDENAAARGLAALSQAAPNPFPMYPEGISNAPQPSPYVGMFDGPSSNNKMVRPKISSRISNRNSVIFGMFGIFKYLCTF